MEIVIEAGEVKARAELFDTSTARKIFECLPLQAIGQTWGDEIYFGVPVQEPLDDTAKERVEIGDLGYWPTGSAMCIFFGPTPISGPDEIKPASAVNIIGRVRGDAGVFKAVPAGSEIRIDSA